MRTSFDMAASQGTYRLRCALCGREWHDSIVGKCPERAIHVCMYCCRMCGNSYKGDMGWGCRVKDAARKKGKKPAAAGAPHQSPAATASPRGSQTAAAGTGKEKTA